MREKKEEKVLQDSRIIHIKKKCTVRIWNKINELQFL